MFHQSETAAGFLHCSSPEVAFMPCLRALCQWCWYGSDGCLPEGITLSHRHQELNQQCSLSSSVPAGWLEPSSYFPEIHPFLSLPLVFLWFPCPLWFYFSSTRLVWFGSLKTRHWLKRGVFCLFPWSFLSYQKHRGSLMSTNQFLSQDVDDLHQAV